MEDNAAMCEFEAVLDLGADVTVFPMYLMRYIKETDIRKKPGTQLRDAQGEFISCGGERADIRLACFTENGQEVVFWEECIFAKVTQPLLCLGKFLKKHWMLAEHSGQFHLQHGDLKLPLRWRNNALTLACSLQQGEADTTEEEQVFDVRYLVMLRDDWKQALKNGPGWTLLEDGTPVHVALRAFTFQDPSGSFSPDFWPYRSTLVQSAGDKFELWEASELYAHKDRSEPLYLAEPKCVVTVLHQMPIELAEFGPNLDEPVEAEPVEQQAHEGEQELVPAPVAGAADAAIQAGEPVPIGEDPAEVDEIVVDGQRLTSESTLSQIREACKFLGISKSGSKATCLQRIRSQLVQLSRKLAIEVAEKLYEEGQRVPDVSPLPKPPTEQEIRAHEVCHLPFAPWCEACVATRSREDGPSLTHEAVKPVLSLDYMFTSSTGEAEARQEQEDEIMLTHLVGVEDYSRSCFAVPIKGKGNISMKQCLEEIGRQTNCYADLVIRGDGEPAMKQLLKSIVEMRTRSGLKTTKEVVPPDPALHRGNRAERYVQTIRRLGNCLLASVENNVKGRLPATHKLRPWAYAHAAWLMNRYSVGKDKKTPFELKFERKYQGKLVPFGSTIFAQYLPKNKKKGLPAWSKGIFVGKQSDTELCLITDPAGVHLARSVRRCLDMWQLGTLMKIAGTPWNFQDGMVRERNQRFLEDRMPLILEDPAEGEIPDELQKVEDVLRDSDGNPVVEQKVPVSVAVSKAAKRLADPAGPELQPAKRSSAPASSSERPMSPSPDQVVTEDRLLRAPQPTQLSPIIEMDDDTPLKRLQEDELRRQAKAGRTENTPSPGRACTPDENAQLKGADVRMVEVEVVVENENEIFPTGDVEYWCEFGSDAGGDVQQDPLEPNFLEPGDGAPPVLTESDMFLCDAQACAEEKDRLVEMGVLKKISAEEAEGVPTLAWKYVLDWRKRPNENSQLVWKRRARLVAKEFKHLDPGREFLYSPSSIPSTLRLLAGIWVTNPDELELWTADVKDAFLNVPQESPLQIKEPQDDGTVTHWLVCRCIPGQRIGTKSWFEFLCDSLAELGLRPVPAAPAILAGPGLAVTTHVDDLQVLGKHLPVQGLWQQFEKKKLKVVTQGPCVRTGGRCEYLKRTFEVCQEGLLVRPHPKYVDSLVKLYGLQNAAGKKNPCSGQFNKAREAEDEVGHQVPEAEWRKFQTAVGILHYLSPDRPDAQASVRFLATRVTKVRWSDIKELHHLIKYLKETPDYCQLLKFASKYTSVFSRLNGGGEEPDTEKDVFKLETLTDADYAGAVDRKSVTAIQLYLSGNLMVTITRTQKNIALSTCETEFTAAVGGGAEMIFLANVLQQLTNSEVECSLSLDNSSARALLMKTGLGRTRHIDCALLWIQQRVERREFEVKAVGTKWNLSDLSTKRHTVHRLNFLLHLMNIYDYSAATVVGAEQHAEEIKRVVTQDVLKVLRLQATEPSPVLRKLTKALAPMVIAALGASLQGCSVDVQAGWLQEHRLDWKFAVIVMSIFLCSAFIFMAFQHMWLLREMREVKQQLRSITDELERQVNMIDGRLQEQAKEIEDLQIGSETGGGTPEYPLNYWDHGFLDYEDGPGTPPTPTRSQRARMRRRRNSAHEELSSGGNEDEPLVQTSAELLGFGLEAGMRRRAGNSV